MDDNDEKSLMDDLAAAWDESEAAEEEDVPRGALEDEPVTMGAQEPQEEVVQEEPIGKATEEPVDARLESEHDTAPKGLSPAAREAWRDTPEAVRAELAKRERDFENGIQKYAENARRAEQMDRTLAPYQNLFAMNGGAQNTLPGLLQTATALQTGSEQVRAQTVANIIQQFGVSIDALADVLEGKNVPQRQRQPQINIQEEIQKALAPMFQQQQRDGMAKVQAEIDAFASDPLNEFYNDVKGDMANLMDVASQQGQELSMQQAYEQACWARPDIRQIMMARQSHNEVGQRRKASVSVSGSPSGQESLPQPETISDYISQAWDQVGNRR